METRDDWALAIGDALLAFGDIELLVVEGIHKLSPRPCSKKSVWERNLARRVDDLSTIAAKIGGASATDVRTLLAQVKKLAKTRNLIAHNPLRLEVYYSEISDNFWFEMVISSPLQKANHLKLSEVRSLADLSRATAVSLADALEKLSLWKLFAT